MRISGFPLFLSDCNFLITSNKCAEYIAIAGKVKKKTRYPFAGFKRLYCRIPETWFGGEFQRNEQKTPLKAFLNLAKKSSLTCKERLTSMANLGKRLFRVGTAMKEGKRPIMTHFGTFLFSQLNFGAFLTHSSYCRRLFREHLLDDTDENITNLFGKLQIG